MENGVIYVCNNSKKHINELIFSISSLKKNNPNLKTALFTNYGNRWGNCFDYYFPIDDNLHPLKSKVSSLFQSPFVNTLYLDVDTEILSDLSPLFLLLDKYDICLGNEPHINYKRRPPEFIGYAKKDEFNTGLILYHKNQSVLDFLQAWHDKIGEVPNSMLKVGELGDQKVFNDLVKSYNINFKLFTLDNKIYNTRYRAYLNMDKNERENVIVKHWHFMNRSKFSLKLEEHYIFLLRLLFKIDRDQIM